MSASIETAISPVASARPWFSAAGFPLIGLQEQTHARIACRNSRARAQRCGPWSRRQSPGFRALDNRKQRRPHRVHDDRFFVVGGNQDGDGRLDSPDDPAALGEAFQSSASRPIINARPPTSRIPAMKMNAMPAAHPAEQIENERICARQQPFVHGSVAALPARAFAPRRSRDGNEFVTLGAKPVNDSRQAQRRYGCDRPPPSCIRIMFPSVCRVGQHALDDRVRRRRRPAIHLAPIVRINARADDDVAHGLRNGKHLNFARRFRLVVDAVGRAEEASSSRRGCFPAAAP